jgi:hypothetical protein
MNPEKFPCPATACPYCFIAKGPGVIAVTPNAQLRPPRPGDISVCSTCGNWAVFNAELQLTEPDEMQKMIAEKSRDWSVIKKKRDEIQRSRRMTPAR